MGPKCTGCDAVISDILYMKCEQEGCKKLYHLKCLTLTKEKFEAFTEEYKLNWRCPECVCSIPKRDNSETPVRGNPVINKTHTPSYVNTERGSRISKKEITDVDSISKIMREIQEFRCEMKLQMEEQIKEYSLLKHRFINTETELQHLRETMKVVQEKVSTVDELEAKIKLLEEKNEQLQVSLSNKQPTKVRSEEKIIEENRETRQVSFAKVVKQNEKEVTQKQQIYPLGKGVDSVATKPTIIKDNNKIGIQLIKTTEKNDNQEKEELWTIVQQKKKRYPSSQVIKGGSTATATIQGTEKKKFLHVWRLKKDTTVESLEIYVKGICGQEVAVTVEKIKHRTERDYASFIIGVPESIYDKLCKPECWAINIEFCEWVWFRKTPYKSENPE